MRRPIQMPAANPPAVPFPAEQARTAVQRSHSRFQHEALLYRGEQGFLEGALPFVNDALAAGEPILVAVGAEKTALLTRALGSDSRRVNFTDMRELGRNPARIIPAWRSFLKENAAGNRCLRAIGEPIWRGRGAAEVSECQRHESLLNMAFEERIGWRLLCPYDLDGLEEDVIEGARRSHPFLIEDGDHLPSGAYLCGPPAPGPFAGTLPAPPAGTQMLPFTASAIGSLRERLRKWASRLELGSERTENLVLAVTELASNSVHHGGGGGMLGMWSEDGTLLVEVHDHGHIEEPLTGRIRPDPEQPAGRGLWLVNHLCDLVQIRSDAAGSVVRVHMHLDPRARDAGAAGRCWS